MIRLPNWVYGAGAVVLGSALALVLTLSYGAGRYQAGRDSVTANVRVDTVMVNTLRRADSTAKAKTDTVFLSVKATARKADSLAYSMPDSLRLVSEVAALIETTHTLYAQVDTLSHTLDIERATSRLRASVDSAALVSASIVIAQKEDEIRSLKKRPQWRTVGTALVIGLVAGVLK